MAPDPRRSPERTDRAPGSEQPLRGLGPINGRADAADALCYYHSNQISPDHAVARVWFEQLTERHLFKVAAEAPQDWAPRRPSNRDASSQV